MFEEYGTMPVSLRCCPKWSRNLFRYSMLLSIVAACPLWAATTDFNREIRPILAENCFKCHGPDPAAREVDLRLDSLAGATADRGGYQPIIPGDPAASELVSRIENADESLRMPPADSGKHLSAEQIDLLKRWIAEGAEYKPHWAFMPPSRPPLPDVSASRYREWAKDPLDLYVLSRLEAAELTPSQEADRRTLLRRVTLDLTGLPPTMEEIESFLS